MDQANILVNTQTSTPPTTQVITQTVFLNGQWLPIDEARIPILDRGFIFGDGIYEVVPFYSGVPFRWAEHRARMSRSLAKIRLTDPYTDQEWEALVHRIVSLHPWADQFVYLHITRGVAKRDHAFPVNATPTVLAIANPFPVTPAIQRNEGVAAVTLADTRWLHCDIKSISLLGNVLARQAAVDEGAVECVMFRDEFLTEGSAANIWVVKNGVLLSPPRDNKMLEGIRVALVDSLCKAKGIALEVRPVTRAEVLSADEMMLSSATKEVLPICKLDGKPVGTGKPGPVYAALYAAYQEQIKASIDAAQMKATAH